MRFLTFIEFFFMKYKLSNFPTKIVKPKKPLYTDQLLTGLLSNYFKKGSRVTSLIMLNSTIYRLLNCRVSSLSPSSLHNFLFQPVVQFLFTFFNQNNFIFHFFCEKLNKKLYKFSNYKLNRFSLKFIYIKPFNRVKKFMFFFSSLLKMFIKSKKYSERLFLLFFSLLYNNTHLNYKSTIRELHYYIFKQFKINLFLLNKTV